MQDQPEIGSSVRAAGIATNYLAAGEGLPVLLLHGSGPGVTAFANWRLVLPRLAPHFHCLAPDIVGFGYTERPAGWCYTLDTWIEHTVGFLDALGIARVAGVIGNSFGGALAVALAARHPQRVGRVVAMGSVAAEVAITPGLEAVWGYEPSPQATEKLIELFVHDRRRITPELVESRYRASIRPGYQECYAQLFPPPRQRHLHDLATPDAVLRTIQHPTLVIHGREDQVIPLAASVRLFEQMPNAELHVFSQCGHWTQVEKTEDFCRLVIDFISKETAPTRS